MRLRTLFVLVLFGFILTGLISSGVSIVSSVQRTFNDHVEDYLVSVISVNEERINDYISELESNIIFLSQSVMSRELMGNELSESRESAVLDVNGGIDVVTREIENYIRAHPEMTLDDLQGSEEFQAIAVRQIGATGYSVVIDRRTGTLLFHINPEAVGMRVSEFFEGSVGISELVDEAVGSGTSSGIYTLFDADGVRREKYAELVRVVVETSDNVSLLSVATTFVDEYKVVENVSDETVMFFEGFMESQGFNNIVFVSHGYEIMYMGTPEPGLGSNIGLSQFGFSDIYPIIKKLNKGEVAFYGPFFYKERVHVAGLSNVYDGEVLLGTVVGVRDISEVNSILDKSDVRGAGGADEDYLVDSSGLLITPPKTRSVNVLVQEIRTVSSEECIEDFGSSEKLNLTPEEYDLWEKTEGLESAFLSFLNYKGDKVFGLHRPIGRVNWCLLSEVSKDEILQAPLETILSRQITVRAILLGLLAVVILFLARFIDKRYFLRKKSPREIEKSIGGDYVKRIGPSRIFGVTLLLAIILGWIIFILNTYLENLNVPMLIGVSFNFLIAFVLFFLTFKLLAFRKLSFVVAFVLIALRALIMFFATIGCVSVGVFSSRWLVPVSMLEMIGFLLLLFCIGGCKR